MKQSGGSTVTTFSPVKTITANITDIGISDPIVIPTTQEYNVYGYGDFTGLTVAVEWSLTSLGVSWTPVTSGIGVNIRDVAFLEGAYIYTATDGHIRTSPDALVGTNSPTGQPLAFLAVTFAVGLYVVVGAVGGILTSPDLVVWTLEPPLIGVQLNDIVFADNQFVTCGFNSNILTSPDGLAWTIQPSPIPTTIFESIAFGNGKFVIVGSGSVILTSTDGETWIQQSKPANMATMQFFSVIFDGTMFILAGGLSSPTGGNIATSVDGETWFLAGPGIPDVNLRTIAFAFDMYLAGGNDGKLFTSPDLLTWTQQASATTNNINAITQGSDLIVLVADLGDISVSSNAEAWSPLKDADGTDVVFTTQETFNVPRIGFGVKMRTNAVGAPTATTNVTIDLR